MLEADSSNTYLLSKEKFELRVSLDLEYALHLNAFNSNYYHVNNFQFSDWHGKLTAIEADNVDTDLFLGIDNILLIAYDHSGLWRPFNSIIVDQEKGRFLGAITVKNFSFWNFDADESVKLDFAAISTPIYLTFILTTHLGPDQTEFPELERIKITIDWKTDSNSH